LIETEAARFLPRLVTRAPDDRLAEECRKLMRGMIWDALRTPLKPLGSMLCHLPKADCVRELEFLFPEATKSAADGEYRTGFMDLVFRWRDAIYLLDWKTNVLASYDAVGLEAGMQDAGYGLQIQLYWEALSRWLRRGAKASKTRLGGVFYLFLRGLNGMDDSTGVYFVPASKVTSMVKRNG
jgi:ATP-dependent exoDNAse (exonuclease V) beta subunit